MAGRCFAMWSGPRNISTAMMRAWENRPDTSVVDEPLYAHFLLATGLEHPGRDLVLEDQKHDWREVASDLCADPGESRVCYQKHMTHHITDDVELDWLAQLDNCFLIRDPDEVVASYRHVRADFEVRDVGFVQQRRIFDHVAEREGQAPPVIDARDVLQDPRGMLRAVCARFGIPFDEAMLAWPAGKRDSDGVWAPWWYSNVEKSTGFAPYAPRNAELDDAQRAISDQCRPHYEELSNYRLEPAAD